ncbi:MAG: threonine synthase [Tissierellaceae bacterium]|nr:threonine synthase [Tissierellaceae bacterium]
MRYFSTRNKDINVSSSEAILKGISEDGGLFVPEEIPRIDNLQDLIDMDYKKLAFRIMSKFLTDFDTDVLKKCIENAYDDKFSSNDIAPLVEVDGAFFLELYHGPTLAFKDMALSILPYLLKESMKIQNIKEEVVILTATSGDTGKAALEGFANVEGTRIIVFYPKNGVSQIQERQMITQEGDNTFVVGINGNFDDAQTGVKEIFADEEFGHLLKVENYVLSSANSINIGRLIPQIVYYFHGYLELLRLGKIQESEMVNIIVPTGNFGNILAAYYAKNMGLPVNKLICASNENKVLTDFINTGVYDKRRDLILTTSPSMDILVSSNLERLLYHLSCGDDKFIENKMVELSQNGFYKIDNLKMEGFYGGYSSEEEVNKTINKLFTDSNYLMDTHSAVAYNVYDKYKVDTKDNTKAIISSTASPFKFGASVASAIGLDIAEDEFSILEDLSKASDLNMPKSIKDLKNKEILHENICDIDDMGNMVKKFLEVGDNNGRS